MYSSHNECYEHELTSIEQASRKYVTEDKNYLSGFLGALIGGIVGSIPCILV